MFVFKIVNYEALYTFIYSDFLFFLMLLRNQLIYLVLVMQVIFFPIQLLQVIKLR